MENKTAEERLRDLIDKHLEFKSGLETTSIQYYAEYGKVSGSMYLNVKRLCEEYASQQLAEKDKEIEEIVIKAMHTVFQWVNIDNDNRVLGDVINDYLESLNK